ncbi:hypothetical protein [Hyphomicrobium sp. ghe19]|uniref:hypothetical protein n=1 Tax=Hyphomicrobium sp. ghe19 TaxID=2682968 RepID=UPI0013677239|nr:hypothetical protein HYPP_02431 [Hyphomicrobium sp. ghe19]
MQANRIAALEAELASWEDTDFCQSMSDDFWYSNPRRKGVLAEISKIEKQIKELKAVAA